MCMLGTFSQYGAIHQNSAVKVDDDLPLEKAVLVGCGVPTGWGSAVYTATSTAGDTVVIYGIGGIGINAVQGARYAGAKNVVAIDPLENKREKALELGATHAFATAAEAQASITELTRGQGADSAIITVGLVTRGRPGRVQRDRQGRRGRGHRAGQLRAEHPAAGRRPHPVPQDVKGSLFGDCNPTYDIPKLLGLYRAGPAEARRAHHPDLHPGPGQRGLRRPAGRQERPRRHRPRALEGMADADDVRRLALAMPHVEEIDSDGFDFRVGGKGFVWSYPERRPASAG